MRIERPFVSTCLAQQVAQARERRVIGLDGRNLVLPHGTGVATYTATLARCLPLICLQPEILMGPPVQGRLLRWLNAALPGARRVQPAPQTAAGWPTQTAPDLFRTAQVHFDMWRRLQLVRAAAAPDVMHWTYPLPLRFVGAPNIYTVHDLIPLLHPDMTPIDPARMRRMLARIVQTADHLVTVSEATRQELINTLGARPEKVTNTWQAVDVEGAAKELPESLSPGLYWLHVGVVERRKNLRRLIEAWRASGTQQPLVLAGPDGWKAAEQIPVNHPGIIRLPWVTRPQLLALIRDARGLLMPSLAEGFGLPVAEAMALGTPVLTSRLGALAEIAGSAALQVDPTDGAAITAGLRALDADPALRASLSRQGTARAQLFTPEAYAKRLESLYASVIP